MRDGDSENKCIVICLQTTNEPRRKSKRKCTNPPLNVNDDGTWLKHKINFVLQLAIVFPQLAVVSGRGSGTYWRKQEEGVRQWGHSFIKVGNLQCAFCCVYCAVFLSSVYSALCNLQCVLCSVYCALCMVQCILCSVYFAVCAAHTIVLVSVNDPLT